MKTINFEAMCNINENSLKLEVNKNGIDFIAQEVVTNDCPNFILPFVNSEIDGICIFKYNIGNMLSIEYNDKRLLKNDYIKLIKGVLSPLMICNEWFLDYHHFYLDPKYIYINKVDFTVKYIYCFSDDYVSSDDDIKQFICNLINSFDIIDDNKLQLELCHILLSNNYTMENILEIVKKYEKDSSEAPKAAADKKITVYQETSVKPQAVAATANIPEGQPNSFDTGRVNVSEIDVSAYAKKSENKKDINNLVGEDELDMLFNDSAKPKKKWSFSELLKGSKKIKNETAVQSLNADSEIFHPTPEPIFNTAASSAHVEVESPSTDLEETQFIDIGENTPTGEKTAALSLIKSSYSNAPQLITLSFSNRDYITIGRSSKDTSYKADYELPAEAKKIGRQHIRIEKHDGKYYIIDLATLNHTYLNGNIIFANQPVLLENEALITFANDAVTYKFILS